MKSNSKTRGSHIKIKATFKHTEPPKGVQIIRDHLVANVRNQFSPELVEKNEILMLSPLMLSPEEYDKLRLRKKEYREKLVQGFIEGFIDGFAERFSGLDLQLKIELPLDNATGSEVFEVTSRNRVLKKHTIAIPSVTLDTNVIFEHWKQRPKAAIVEKLLELGDIGQIDLCVTSRIREDIPKPSLSDEIDIRLKQDGIREIGSIIRIGHWRPGQDMPGSTKFQEVVDSLPDAPNRQKKKPPDWRDWDHVQAHYLSERDVFLTWDGGILNAAPHFKEKLGIVIMEPEEYLRYHKRQIESKSFR